MNTTETVWVARHGALGDAFFDVDAAAFLAEALFQKRSCGVRAHAQTTVGARKRKLGRADGDDAKEFPEVVVACGQHSSYATFEKLSGGGRAAGGEGGGRETLQGSAVGPEWVKMLRATDTLPGASLTVELECEVVSLVDAMGTPVYQAGAAAAALDKGKAPDDEAEWPLYATLTNGHRYGVDLVVWATGVEPNTAWVGDALTKAADGGVVVDRQLRTNVDGVFAAGDAASVGWDDPDSNWFQMRLWTQVRGSLHSRARAHAVRRTRQIGWRPACMIPFLARPDLREHRRECLGGLRRLAWRVAWMTWRWGSTLSSSPTPLASSTSR